MKKGNSNGANKGDTYQVEVNGDTHEVTFLDDDGKVLFDGEEVLVDAIPKVVPDHYSFLMNNESLLLGIEPQQEQGRYLVHAGGYDFDIEVISSREAFLREFLRAAGVGKKVGRVTAPMPGMIIKNMVEEGAQVDAEDGIVIMVAMKMENEIKTPVAGTVKKIHVQEGDAVEKGAVLFEVE